MAREPKTTQDEPTKERPLDPEGRMLDEHGLPLNGPARLRALGGRPDPRDAGEAPAVPAAPATAQKD